MVSLERGPLPTQWGPNSTVVWRAELPGRGWSSPVVDQKGVIYVTSAVAEGEADAPAEARRELRVLAISGETGVIVWEKTVFTQGGPTQSKIHKKNSHASPTPVLAGNVIFVHFGHQGTACLRTKDGSIIWQNNSISYAPVHGNGGSPLLVGDQLIFSCDGARNPFVLSLDGRTGRIRWKRDRQTTAKRTFSFSTPILVTQGGKSEVILPGSGNLFAYDPRSGRELWRCPWGEGYSVVPRPVFGHGLIFASSGYDRPVLYAVPPGGQGTVSAEWTFTGKGVPRNSSFCLVGEALFTIDDKGIGSCLNAMTGELLWQERILSDTSASLLAQGNSLYATDELGTTVVYQASSEGYAPIAENRLNERTLASLAVIENDILQRTETTLYRLGQN